MRENAFCKIFHVKWIFLTTSLQNRPEGEGGIRRQEHAYHLTHGEAHKKTSKNATYLADASVAQLNYTNINAALFP